MFSHFIKLVGWVAGSKTFSLDMGLKFGYCLQMLESIFMYGLS